jgi:putative ABC transport system permease protein
MVMRELERRPLRTLSSSLGIAGAVALIILGHFGVDSLDAFLNGTFLREQRQDLTVSLIRPLSPRAVAELARIPGVLRAEGVRAVSARARNESRQRDVLVLGLPAEAVLRRVVARGGQAVELPADGVVLTRTLASVLGVAQGERLDLELREGKRAHVRALVVGLVDDTAGLNVYAQTDMIAALEHDLGAVSQVLLDVEPARARSVEARLRTLPNVLDVSDLRGSVQRLRDMNGAAMDVWALVSITLSACIILGVVYNNARISLEARSRELASMRVLGFSRGEISAVLIGGLAAEVGLAIPLGLALGFRWAALFMESSLDPETMRWVVVIAPRTYLLASVVVVLAGAASALWVRRSLDRLDLIGVLKTRE